MWTVLTATFLFTLSLGIPAELAEVIAHDASASTAAWQPPVGAKFQITLSRGVSGGGLFRVRNIETGSAEILDLDLFDTSKAQIQQLHAQGKRVLCYFSAGSSESWRTDFKQLQAKDMGDQLRDWPGEKWLDIRSPDIFGVMQARIKMASEKGCDGVDPDNVDAYGDESHRGGGFQVPLTAQDTINFIQKLATEAHQYGLAIGLKNAESILPKVSNIVEFAVNEQCATYSSCKPYQSFISSGKPVFHIEYAHHSIENGTNIKLKADGGHDQLQSLTTEQLHSVYCLQTSIGSGNRRNLMSQETALKFSTVIKNMDLNNWVMYCDGTWEGAAPGATNAAKGAKSQGKGAKPQGFGFKPEVPAAGNEAKGVKPDSSVAWSPWSGKKPEQNVAQPSLTTVQPASTAEQSELNAAKPVYQPAYNQAKGARPDLSVVAPQWGGVAPETNAAQPQGEWTAAQPEWQATDYVPQGTYNPKAGKFGSKGFSPKSGASGSKGGGKGFWSYWSRFY